jgi:hypothetical protein
LRRFGLIWSGGLILHLMFSGDYLEASVPVRLNCH